MSKGLCKTTGVLAEEMGIKAYSKIRAVALRLETHMI